MIDTHCHLTFPQLRADIPGVLGRAADHGITGAITISTTTRDAPEALAIAEERGLDLVEVAPTARPPVCRIMDYGKYKYEQKKKAGKGKGHAASLKEVKPEKKGG